MDTDMELNNYFDFFTPDDIRIRGTRVGIETVLEDYFSNATPQKNCWQRQEN